MSECQCGGAGFETLTDDDLIMLSNIMMGRKDDVATGTRMAIRKELYKRGVRNV
jgi:hypothetical protein